MFRMIICAIAMAVIATATSAEPKNDRGGSTSTVYRFAGYTDGTINGAGGILARNALCQDDFGDLALMCTSKEFFRSPNAEAHPDDLIHTWLHPDLASRDSDFSGVRTNGSSISCSAWAVTGGIGLSINQGKARTAGCGTPRPVTCCAPLQ